MLEVVGGLLIIGGDAKVAGASKQATITVTNATPPLIPRSEPRMVKRSSNSVWLAQVSELDGLESITEWDSLYPLRT